MRTIATISGEGKIWNTVRDSYYKKGGMRLHSGSPMFSHVDSEDFTPRDDRFLLLGKLYTVSVSFDESVSSTDGNIKFTMNISFIDNEMPCINANGESYFEIISFEFLPLTQNTVIVFKIRDIYFEEPQNIGRKVQISILPEEGSGIQGFTFPPFDIKKYQLMCDFNQDNPWVFKWYQIEGGNKAHILLPIFIEDASGEKVDTHTEITIELLYPRYPDTFKDFVLVGPPPGVSRAVEFITFGKNKTVDTVQISGSELNRVKARISWTTNSFKEANTHICDSPGFLLKISSSDPHIGSMHTPWVKVVKKFNNKSKAKRKKSMRHPLSTYEGEVLEVSKILASMSNPSTITHCKTEVGIICASETKSHLVMETGTHSKMEAESHLELEMETHPDLKTEAQPKLKAESYSEPEAKSVCDDEKCYLEKEKVSIQVKKREVSEKEKLNRQTRANAQTRNGANGTFTSSMRPIIECGVKASPDTIIILESVSIAQHQIGEEVLNEGIFCKEYKNNHIKIDIFSLTSSSSSSSSSGPIYIEARLIYVEGGIVESKNKDRPILSAECMCVPPGKFTLKIRIEEISRSHKQYIDGKQTRSGSFCIQIKPSGVESHEWLTTPPICVITKYPQKKMKVIEIAASEFASGPDISEFASGPEVVPEFAPGLEVPEFAPGPVVPEFAPGLEVPEFAPGPDISEFAPGPVVPEFAHDTEVSERPAKKSRFAHLIPMI